MMLLRTIGIVMLAASLLVESTAGASVINACAKNSNGKVRKLVISTSPAPTCNPNSETAITINGDPAPASPLVAFARIAYGGSIVDSFGGNGTTAATVTGVPGSYIVTFTGVYPSSDASKITVLSSAESLDYGVSNARVNSVTPTEIQVQVFGWVSSDTSNTADETLFVAVLAVP